MAARAKKQAAQYTATLGALGVAGGDAVSAAPQAPVDPAHAEVGGDEQCPEQARVVDRVRERRRSLRSFRADSLLTPSRSPPPPQLAAEVFTTYQCHTVTVGVDHPGDISEASSLQAIRLPPSSYPLLDAIPSSLVTSGALSRLQLEGVLYACTAHSGFLADGVTRCGFFLGDGAGVGKGRQVAGMVLDSCARGRRKHVWLSTSSDLLLDAQRDLRDLGVHVRVVDGPVELEKETKVSGLSKDCQEGVLFVTYSSLTSATKKHSRMDQIVAWCGPGFDGCLIFDEAHKAKNYTPGKESASTKVAACVIAIQAALPRARVVYCSATGVSEIGNLAYMTRMGFWGQGTAFASADEFMSSLSKRGLGYLELLALELKARGAYLSRSLSFKDAEFAQVECMLLPQQARVYDTAVEVWTRLRGDLAVALQRTRAPSQDILKVYWGTAQRFFKLLCVSLKLPTVLAEVQAALDAGMCAVIGLQSTGEAATSALELMPGERTPFISVCRQMLARFVRDHFPVRVYGAEGASTQQMAAASAAHATLMGFEADDAGPAGGKAKRLTNEELSRLPECPACLSARASLLAAIEDLDLPDNPVDALIDALGGPDLVAEMTGRKARIVRGRDGRTVYQVRAQPDSSHMDSLNIAEKSAFMTGKKLVAVLSAAASTGISLHSDARAGNTRRRVHITVELSWAADASIQQLGRTHRSNQVSPPLYKLLITSLGGERRFAAAVARRLQSLGALTRGDRRAASGLDLSDSNLDTPLGRKALRRLCDSLADGNALPAGVALADVLNVAEAQTLLDVDADHATAAPSLRTAAASTFASPAALLAALRPAAAMLGVGLPGEGMADVAQMSADVLTGDKAATAANLGDVRRFLNRLLIMPVASQSLLFRLFLATFASEVRSAKLEGHYSEGMSDLPGREITPDGPPTILHRARGSTLPTRVTTLSLDRGVSFDTAVALLVEAGGASPDGFYVSRREMYGRSMYILAVRNPGQKHLFGITRPNTGASFFEMDKDELRAKYAHVDTPHAQDGWTCLFESSLTTCMHGTGCTQGSGCVTGKRLTKVTILHGSVVPVWGVLEAVLKRHEHSLSKADRAMRAVRVELAGGARLVGVRYPGHLLVEVSARLATQAAEQATQAAAGPSVAASPAGRVQEAPAPVDAKSLTKTTTKPKTMLDFFTPPSQPRAAAELPKRAAPAPASAPASASAHKKGKQAAGGFFSAPPKAAICPVCQTTLAGLSNGQVNEHLDACIAAETVVIDD